MESLYGNCTDDVKGGISNVVVRKRARGWGLIVASFAFHSYFIHHRLLPAMWCPLGMGYIR